MSEPLITVAFPRLMARYNRWQNESLYREAGRLDDDARKADRGAFFKSIHGTLNHMICGDKIWLHRFAGLPLPRARTIAETPFEYDDFAHLAAERRVVDDAIQLWAEKLDPAWLAGDLMWWSGALGREVRRPCAELAVHFFNHQTHHRGQVHAMLTTCGMSPDDTDLPFMP